MPTAVAPPAAASHNFFPPRGGARGGAGRGMFAWLLAVLGSLAWLGCGATLPVSPVVEIAPASANLQAGGGQQQFTATVLNTTNSGVVWKVNGVLGGSAANGTVSQTGLYLAPAAIPSGAVAVEAVSVANDNSQASAAITLTAGVAVNVAPTAATVAGGGTQQFTATVANASNTAVTWSVNGTVGGSATVGTISDAGLYTAPATFPGLSQVTITVASVEDPSMTATATVTLSQPVSVTVSPANAEVNVGATQVFQATVSGPANTAVTWSVNGITGGNASVGTIDATGVFTAPAALPSPAAETVTATSQADPTVAANAQVTIVAPVTISLSPTSASLNPGGTQQFTATVANAANPAVVWSVNGTAGGTAAMGTISTTGLYTAPTTFPGVSQVTVGATSVQNPSVAATALVTLNQVVAVAISPTSATVNLGATQAFQATVSGTANTAVTWSVDGAAGGSAALGTISTGGVFTAPTTLPTPATETVTATSVADATQSATAQITLQAPPAEFTITPGNATLSLGKAMSGTQAFQVALSAGFANPVTFTVSGLPVNVTGSVSPASITASGTATLTLTTASISLAASGVPITVTASSTDAGGAPIVQTATVLLTITGWAGNVATLAGGPGGVGFQDGSGTTDELDASAVVSDGGQNLYFSDRRGNALRAYSLATQAVTTVIGGPYNYTVPNGQGMAYNPNTQTVYIVDSTRNQVLEYTLGGYSMQVLAGSGVAGYTDGVGGGAQFDFPHGLAISPDFSTLYVADTSNSTIRVVKVATGAVTTLAGQYGIYRSTDGVGTAATFCEPTGLDIDGAGTNLYVTDNCGDVVRKIAIASATVTTIAGSGAVGQTDGAALSATFSDLNGVKVDPHTGSPLLYLTDGNEIRVLTLGASPTVYTLAGGAGGDSGQSDGNGGQANFYDPNGLTAIADSTGPNTTSLFIADTDNGLLRRMDISNPLTATSSANVTLNVTTIAGQPSDRGASDGAGTGTGYTGTSTAQFSQPEGIVTDGKVAYVADSYNGAIREINLATTAVTTVAGPHQGYGDGPASGAAFYQNAGLSWLPSQNVIYIADAGNGAIRELNLATQTVSTVAGTNASGYQDGPAASALFNHPFGVLASSDGTKLYVADTGNNALRLVDLTTGMVSTIAGNGGLGSADGIGTAATFAEPNGLAFDATGANIFISDFENEAIREFNIATGAVTTVVGTAHTCGYADGPAASATLCHPAFITTDGRSLFWGDSDTGLLRVLNLTTQQVSTLAGSPGLMHMMNGAFTETPGELTGPVLYNGVFGLAVSPDDSVILFTDKTANVVRIIY